MKEAILEMVRAVPSSLQLVFRLLRDDRVDDKKRAGVLAALVYAVLPFDFLPDRFPVIGRIDDIVIGAAALQLLFDEAGEEIIREHWDGSDGGLEGLLGIVETVSSFIPKPLRRLLRTG